MKLTLGFSPCPNDTFIFDALVNNKIDTEGLEFEVVLEDVEALNKRSARGDLDITKLSFPALFAHLLHYALLRSGAALGEGVGPLLVSKKMVDVHDVAHCSIAIPGEMTTANLLLHFAFPEATNRKAMIFSDIESAVLRGETDLGVLIHEGRFTYQEKGLVKICDLGEVWEKKTGVPIPLGCIAAHRRLPKTVAGKVEELIQQSIAFARAHEPVLAPFVTDHAQEMSEAVMRSHIGLYVNQYSILLDEKAESAIRSLQNVFAGSGNEESDTSVSSLFLD